MEVQRTFKGAEANAQRALAEFVAEGVAPPADRRTFGELLDEWVEFKAPRWAPKTLHEARREIENRIRSRLGAIRVAKLTPKHLDTHKTKGALDCAGPWPLDRRSQCLVFRPTDRRPGTDKSLVRMLRAMRLSSGVTSPNTAVHLMRSWASTAHMRHAAFAKNSPDGTCSRPEPSFRTLMARARRWLRALGGTFYLDCVAPTCVTNRKCRRLGKSCAWWPLRPVRLTVTRLSL